MKSRQDYYIAIGLALFVANGVAHAQGPISPSLTGALGRSSLSALAPQPSILSNVVGCDASGAKQGVGALAGGALGGLAGNKLLKSNKTIGTIAGAGVGAAAGSWIGCKMQRADQARAAANAPEPAPDSPTRWTSARDARVRAGALDDVTFEPGIEPVGALATDRSGRYVAEGSLRIHTQPAANAPVVGWIAAAGETDVLASVTGTPWLLVGRGSVARGYVSGALLRPVGEASVAASSDGCRIVHQTSDGEGPALAYRACPRKEGGWTMSRL